MLSLICFNIKISVEKFMDNLGIYSMKKKMKKYGNLTFFYISFEHKVFTKLLFWIPKKPNAEHFPPENYYPCKDPSIISTRISVKRKNANSNRINVFSTFFSMFQHIQKSWTHFYLKSLVYILYYIDVQPLTTIDFWALKNHYKFWESGRF